MALTESAGGTGTWPTNAGAVTTGTITPASGDLLVAIAACGNGSNNAATSIAMSGTGAMSGTWTLKAHLYLTTGPMVGIFMKDAGASPSSGTATATFSSPTEGAGLIVRRFAGAAATASQTGVTVTGGSAGGGVYSLATGTGVTTGSQVVGGFADSSNSITLTANGSSSIYNQGNGSGGDTEAAFKASSLSTGGTSVTLGFSNTGSDSTSIVLVEVLAASGTSAAAGLASGTGAALNATATSNATSAAAGLASGTGAALGASVLITLPPFPQTPLGLQCDLNLGGTWTGIPASLAYQRDGMQPPVTITRGRPDESSQANPATCAWQWNNRDGRFSPRNPAGPYYGQLGRNTPVRWSVPAQANYLRVEGDAVSGATCPDASGLHVTGDIDVRVDVELSGQQLNPGGFFDNILAAKYGGDGSGNNSWYFQLGVAGLEFGWSPDGSSFHAGASTVPPPYRGRGCLRATMQASTGTVTFYAGPAGGCDGSTWTQLGDAVAGTGGASTSIFAGTAAVSAGYYPFNPGNTGSANGAWYEAEVRSGIGGTVVAHPVFSAQSAGTASFADAQGNTWTVRGTAEISSRNYRFHGEMSALPPRWDVTGADQWVAAAAGGPLRRLQQGTANAMSAMKRAILLQSGTLAPVAYWPMEDAKGATRFGAAIGGNPLTWSGGPPSLASDSSLLSSAPLPALNGAVLSASVPSYTGGTAWTVRFAFKLGSTLPASQARLLTVSATGACTLLEVLVDADGTLTLNGFDASGTQQVSLAEQAFPELPGPAYWSLEATPSGGNVLYALVAVSPGASVGNAASSAVAGAAGNVLSYQVNSDGVLPDTVIGQVQVQAAWASLFTLGSPLNAWQGEAAAARYARLARENGYQARVIGAPGTSAAMGAQGQATLSALLQECETADMGQQYEPRQQLALGYRTLASMCSQSPALTLSYTSSQPGGVSGSAGDSGLDPTYDDQLTANDWTVTRGAASGSQGGTWQSQLDDGSAMSISSPPVGVGDYAKTQTANVQADSQLPDVAGWLVHRGSVDDERWPSVPVNLARAEMSSLQGAAMQLEVGDMIEVTGLPQAVLYDPVKQLAYGFREALGGFHWTIEYNCVPEQPYEVIILDDLTWGRLDTDGSTLAAGVSSGATTLSVATTGSNPIWTTTAGDFPFDIAIAGERITVTNITGSSSPQSFTVIRSVNSVVKSQSAGADVRLWIPPILALT